MRACTPEQLLHTEPIDPYAAHNKKTEKIKAGDKQGGGYVSERPPRINNKTIYRAVGKTLNQTIHNDTSHDLLLYFFWHHRDPEKHKASRHAQIWPRFEAVAELLDAIPRRPTTLRFARIDAGLNELPPPWDHVVKDSSVTHFAAGRTPFWAGVPQVSPL